MKQRIPEADEADEVETYTLDRGRLSASWRPSAADLLFAAQHRVDVPIEYRRVRQLYAAAIAFRKASGSALIARNDVRAGPLGFFPPRSHSCTVRMLNSYAAANCD